MFDPKIIVPGKDKIRSFTRFGRFIFEVSDIHLTKRRRTINPSSEMLHKWYKSCSGCSGSAAAERIEDFPRIFLIANLNLG